MVSLGSTICHSFFESKSIKKGQPGLQRAMDNPIKISLGNEKKEEIAKMKNLLALEIGRVFPQILDNLKPDENEFEVTNYL